MSYTITVTINADDTWSYDEDTVLIIPGRSEPFHHTDRNVLTRIGATVPNPLAKAALEAAVARTDEPSASLR